MTEIEKLRQEYLNNPHYESKRRNICTRKPNWNGCGYCDVYGSQGCECWKQGGKIDCIGVVEMEV